MCVRIPTTHKTVLAQFSRFSIANSLLAADLQCHHRKLTLDGTCLVKLALISGCTLGDDQSIMEQETNLGCFLEQQFTRQQQLLHLCDRALS